MKSRKTNNFDYKNFLVDPIDYFSKRGRGCYLSFPQNFTKLLIYMQILHGI